jgi:hypothetical protein
MKKHIPQQIVGKTKFGTSECFQADLNSQTI